MTGDDIAGVTSLLAKTKVASGEELSFAGKGLKLETEQDAEEIVKAINSCSDMTALRLEGNTFGVMACKAIAKALESHSEFQKAYWKDMFTGRLKTEIPEALRFLSSGIMLASAKLAEIDLSDNAFGPIGVDGILELLRSEACYSLKELRLNNNGLGIGGGKKLALALMDCHTASSGAKRPLALKVFVSGRNRLENDGAKALAQVFKTLRSLEEVAMPQNGIYHEGISALAEAFSVNPHLKVINLNDNTFTEIGAASMCAAIAKLHNLETINFGDCLLKTEGATSVAAVLKVGHSKLQEVHLGFNEIREEGGVSLAESMLGKPRLQLLDIDGNQFGEEGCDRISAILEGMDKLHALGPLEDDEGDGGDDEDEDEEEDEEDDQQEEEDHPSPLKPTPVTVKTGVVRPEQVTAKVFLEAPSAARLLGLGNNRGELLVAELGEVTPEKAVSCFIKVSAFVGEENGEVKEAACQCADAVFARMFKTAEACGDNSVISNTILVHLGLIKSEDKKFRATDNLLGPLTVLEYVIRRPYFPRSTKEILQVFLSRPTKAVEACGVVKHKLMQTLYQF